MCDSVPCELRNLLKLCGVFPLVRDGSTPLRAELGLYPSFSFSIQSSVRIEGCSHSGCHQWLLRKCSPLDMHGFQNTGNEVLVHGSFCRLS